MVEELKLAIKIDDDVVEQSLLKQFNNAEKMADKVVLTFKNINLDDKNIEAKFKEMQKMAGKNPIDLSINDKSLEMLSAINKQLSNIFEIAKGKSLIDSSSTVSDIGKIANATNQQVEAIKKTTSAYKNQAYELASVLKMLEKMDRFNETSYAGAMSKAVKANAKSYKKDDIIQFSSKDYNVSEDALKQLRGLSVNLESAFNYSDTLGLDTATIKNVEVLIQYFRELLKEKLEFNNVKLNTADIEELIKALGIAKKEVFDDGTGKKINSYDGYLNKYSSVSEITAYLKQQERQALATAEAEQKLANVQQQSSNSSFAENQDKIQQELKETEQIAEQTAEALEKVNSNGNKSNISSENEIKLLDSISDKLIEIEKIKNKISFAKENGEDVRLLTMDLYTANEKLKDLTAVRLQEELKDVLNTTNIWYRRIKSISELLTDTGGYFSDSLLSAASYFDTSDYRQQMIAVQLDTSNFFKLDAKGNSWNSLEQPFEESGLKERFEKLNVSVDDFIEKYHVRVDLGAKYTTEFVANVAKELGYLGIIFENINDNSIFSANGTILPATTTSVQVFDDSSVSNVKNITNLLLGTSDIIENIDKNRLKEIISEGGDLIATITQAQKKLVEMRKTTDGKGTSTAKLEKIKQLVLEIESSDFKNLDELSKRNLMENLASNLEKIKSSSAANKFADIYNPIIQSIEQKLLKVNSTIEDVFQDGSDSSSTAIVNEQVSAMEKVETATEQAAQAKQDFVTANENVQSSVDDSKSPLQLEAELMQQIAKDARDAADAKKEFVEANKQVEQSANDSNGSMSGGHSDNAEPSGTKRYKKKGYKAHDTGNHDNEETVAKKSELGATLKKLQPEIIASIDESTSFIKEVTDFYDSANDLVKAQMKVVDKDGSQRTYTTSYSKDGDDFKAWTSHIDTQKFKNAAEQETKALNSAYEEATKINNALNETQILMDNLSKHPEFSSQFSETETKVGELNAQLKNGEISLSEYGKSVKSVVNDYSKLVDIQQKNSETQLNNIDKKISSFNSSLQNLSFLPDADHSFSSWTNKLDAISKKIQELETLKDNVRIVDGIANEDDLTRINTLTKEIDELLNTAKKTPQLERGWKDINASNVAEKIYSILEKNTNMSTKAKKAIMAYYNEIVSGNPSKPLNEILNECIQIEQAERAAGRAGKSWLDIFKDKKIYGFIGQMASMFSFYDIINIGKQGFETITELNTAMVEVRKVSDETEASYANFQKTVASTAKEIASTNVELLNSSAEYLRLGYSLEESAKLAENTALFVNVGDGVDIDEATEDIITAMKAFNIEAEDSMKIVDSYNQIGNRFALSASDIGEAMKRSASALETANNSFEESIGLITAMAEITQDAETTGTSLKVMSLRMRGAKADLESMGENTDGLAESTSKLREQIQSLTGVDIMVDDNTFKSTARQIKELGAVWDNLSDTSQAATLELIAGKTRANAVQALIKNYEKIDEVIAELENAEGSALRENEAIVDSIEGRIKILSATVEEFWQSFKLDDLIKDTISAITTLLELVTQLVDKAGLLGTIGIGAGLATGIKNVG